MDYRSLIWNDYDMIIDFATRHKLKEDAIVEMVKVVRNAYNCGANDVAAFLQCKDVNGKRTAEEPKVIHLKKINSL